MPEIKKPESPASAIDGAALARALECRGGWLRDNIIANLKGGAYKRPEDLEADLLALEAMPLPE